MPQVKAHYIHTTDGSVKVERASEIGQSELLTGRIPLPPRYVSRDLLKKWREEDGVSSKIPGKRIRLIGDLDTLNKGYR